MLFRLATRPPLLAIVSILLLGSLRASLADVSTDLPGAILVFPKIVSSANEETIIQITNATGSRIFARCFYLDGETDPGTGEPVWLITDFRITLTRLQPTVWVAGQGLPAIPPDRPIDLYPGLVPPVSLGFTGELRCIVVDETDTPISQNALIGDATLVDRTTRATRKYQGITLQGLSDNDGDDTLLLNDHEYSSCPRVLLLNSFFDDAPDPVTGAPIESTLTLVPCSMDLELTAPGTATAQFDVSNEFEQRLSASLAVTCFADVAFSSIDGQSQRTRSIFNFALQGTLVGQIRMRPAVDADTRHGHGLLAIAEEFRDNRQTGSAVNLHFIGGNLQSDIIVLPSL